MSKLKIPVSGSDHAEGSENAPLVLVEYGDYQCSYCGQAYPIIKRLQKTLKKDLCLIFRNFPLSQMHPDALNAALAAEAAALQGKFWEMHDMLYENQENLDKESLISFAVELGLNADKFSKDMESQKIAERISSDFNGGVRSGVNGTPAFFINGVRYDGNWSDETFLGDLKKIQAEADKQDSLLKTGRK